MLNYQGRLKNGGKVTSFLSQSASLSGAIVGSSLPSGLYRVSVYAETSTAGSGSVSFSVGFTTDSGAKSLTIPAGFNLTSNNAATSAALIRSISTITISSTYAGTGAYSVWVLVERGE